MRLKGAEQALEGRRPSDALWIELRRALGGDIKPIDDVRSSADYRLEVTGNVLEGLARRIAEGGH